MKHLNLKTFTGCILLVWIACLCACSDPGPKESKSKEGAAEETKDESEVISSAEYLKQALAWAEGKTPEAMIAELAKSEWRNADEGLYWRYHIAQIVFIETYGEEEAATRMNEAFSTLTSKSPHTYNNRSTHRYSGELGSEYPDIYEIAQTNPKRALQKLEALLLHPEKKLALRAEVIAAYGQEHPAEALELIDQSTNIVKYRAQKKILFAWAEKDAAKALSYLDKLSEKRSMAGLRHDLLLEMVEYDPIRALEAATNSPINSQSDWTFEKVAEAYVRNNPEMGYDWLMQQESLSANLLEAGVDGLSAKHPDLADALMKTVAPERWQSHFVRDIAKSKAEQDIFAALAWANELPWESHRSSAYFNVLNTMARNQPDQLVTRLDSISEMGITTKGYSNIVKSLATNHPEIALRWIKSAPDSPASARLLGLAGEQLMKKDPSRIGELLAAMSGDGFKSAGIGNVVKGWMDADPEGALIWVKNQASHSQLEHIIPEIEEKWSSMDAKAAVDFAKDLPPGEARTTILERYVKDESAKDLPGVVQLLNSVIPGEDLHQLMNTAFEKGAAGDPDRAKALALSVKDPETRDLAIRGVMSTLYKEDLAEAAEWAEEVKFETVKNMKYALNPIIDNWAKKDTDKLLEWVATITEPDKRQHAALRSTHRIDRDDTVTAARLINLAPPDNGRTRSVMNVLRRLPDSYARDAFVSSVFLNKEEQDQIMEERERNEL